MRRHLCCHVTAGLPRWQPAHRGGGRVALHVRPGGGAGYAGRGGNDQFAGQSAVAHPQWERARGGGDRTQAAAREVRAPLETLP
eukprot:1111477-Prorocentrum_minimum.AAC.1